MKKKSSMAISAIMAILSLFLFSDLRAQDVGIGTTTPLYRLHVAAAKSSLLKLENTNALNTGVSSDLFFATGAYYTGAIKTIGMSPLLARLGFFTLASADSSLLLERLSILDNGNVGIGTVSPGAKLEVNGQVKITGGSPALGKVLTSNASGLATWELVPASGILGTINYVSKFVTTTSVGNSQIFDNGTNVGVGTASPGAKLEVSGQVKITGGTPGVNKILTSDAVGLATWEPGLSGSILYVPKFITANSLGSSQIIDDGVNVGIGGPFPATKLHVYTGGTAIRGESTDITGIVYGVHGITNSAGGYAAGVYGEALNVTGPANGVFGKNISTQDYSTGVFGYMFGGTGKNFGVEGLNSSTTDGAAGVYGYADASSGATYGVYGKSRSGSESAAGLKGEGYGTSGSAIYAAALEINNGAIRVTGSAKPAGSVPLPGPWTLVNTCSAGSPIHFHGFAWTCKVTITNDLIKPDSYIFLTSKLPDIPQAAYGFTLLTQGPGTALAAVSVFGPFCPSFSSPGSLNYLIINHD